MKKSDYVSDKYRGAAILSQEMSKMYHNEMVQTRENFTQDDISYISFQYNAGQARYWAEQARKNLHLLMHHEKMLEHQTPQHDEGPARFH